MLWKELNSVLKLRDWHDWKVHYVKNSGVGVGFLIEPETYPLIFGYPG